MSENEQPTQDLATNKPQSRSRASGRFQRVTAARFRDVVGAPARVGRPPAVTPELAAAAAQLLREGATIKQLCERLGVDRRSWYRYVHRVASRVRRYARTSRPPRSISADLERRILSLARAGLTHSAIAERCAVHVNTVSKYVRRAAKRVPPTPPDQPPGVDLPPDPTPSPLGPRGTSRAR